jgi:hypothetical protein
MLKNALRVAQLMPRIPVASQGGYPRRSHGCLTVVATLTIPCFFYDMLDEIKERAGKGEVGLLLLEKKEKKIWRTL